MCKIAKLLLPVQHELYTENEKIEHGARRQVTNTIMIEDFDIDGLLVKYESGKYSVRYATELTELAGGQKLVSLYDPSGNLIEVRTPFRCN